MTAPQPHFSPRTEFSHELRRRVDAYFEQTGRARSGGIAMAMKSALILAWVLGSYLLLLFAADQPWEGLVLAVSLGLSMAAVGFSIQHDANHGAYARRGWINRSMGVSLDLLGGSSHYWIKKHNGVHHTFPNVVNVDDDIDLTPLARLAPGQPSHPAHRFQQWYAWGLYALLAFKWHLRDDFRSLMLGQVGSHEARRPRGWGLVTFVVAKLCFVGWALAIPLALHPAPVVLACFTIASLTLGLTLAVAFQLAHCVEEAGFVELPGSTARLACDWETHQLQTTVDFAPRNRWLTWYLGGLNFQIEHHLFPKVCHLHYPALAPIVQQTCAEFGVPYQVHGTFRSALASHWRWLRRMGR